jgi:murein DD-endopeptidase MepM/ murein hydrolase activator NlpD
MHLIITDAWLAKTKPLHFSGLKLMGLGLLAALVLMLVSLGLYHLVFLKGAREGWPVIGSMVRLVVKDEAQQRERFMRENIDVMAKRVGELQAKVVQLEQLTERVSQLAGVPIPALARASAPGRGGPEIGARSYSLEELQKSVTDLEQLSGHKVDALMLLESRLFDQKIAKLMVPTAQPVPGSHLGSFFGWRTDPITGRSALHTGLDFQAAPGTPILAAAGGVVVVQEYHVGYGNMVEVDHGNGLITRYAHALEVFVKKGDLIKRGQKIASVGSTGRSTGPHLHFEVIADGVQQDPQKFLTTGGAVLPPVEGASAAKAEVGKVLSKR